MTVLKVITGEGNDGSLMSFQDLHNDSPEVNTGEEIDESTHVRTKNDCGLLYLCVVHYAFMNFWH